MSKIKKDELNRVINSLYKEKPRVLPANQKKIDSSNTSFKLGKSKQVIYLIDGYNLMHSIETLKKIAEKDLISARDKVIDLVCDYQGYSGKQCVLVFDAYKNNTPMPVVTKSYNITLVYTKQGQSADMYIEQKTKELNEQYKIYVVTSDALEQLRIFSNDCLRMPSSEFIHRYENYQKNSKVTIKNKKHQPLKELRKLLFEED